MAAVAFDSEVNAGNTGITRIPGNVKNTIANNKVNKNTAPDLG